MSQAPPQPSIRTHAGTNGQPACPRSPGTRGEGAAAASFVGQSSLRREATCSRGCGDGERLHEFVIPPRTREGNQLASPSTSARSVGKRPTTGLVCPQCSHGPSLREFIVARELVRPQFLQPLDPELRIICSYRKRGLASQCLQGKIPNACRKFFCGEDLIVRKSFNWSPGCPIRVTKCTKVVFRESPLQLLDELEPFSWSREPPRVRCCYCLQ